MARQETTPQDPYAHPPRAVDLVARMTRLYPFLSGCSFPNSKPFLSLLSARRAEDWAPVRGGAVVARLDDYVGRNAYFLGDMDRKISALFDAFIREGDEVVDLGANIGITTLAMAELVGPAGKVHAFEPNPEIASLLRAAIERARAGHVSLRQLAVSERPGVLTLCAAASNTGSGSIVENRVGAIDRSYEVEVTTLDAIADHFGPVRLMKMDIEGAELDALRGAANFFAEKTPDIVIFEWNVAADAPHRGGIYDWFSDAGYKVTGICKSLLRLKLDPLTRAQFVAWRGFDFVAFRNGENFEADAARVRLEREAPSAP